VALPAVKAAAAVLCGDEAGLADAVEAGLGVDAAPPVAGMATCLALVLVHTLLPVNPTAMIQTLSAFSKKSVGAELNSWYKMSIYIFVMGKNYFFEFFLTYCTV
jgi:hypothetical protein